MNEIALSNNLEQIEFEINYHKENAGKSIWEIGRRLIHVKENDLAHGEFIKWLEKMSISHSSAKKMMKVVRELPNGSTSNHLGLDALYLITTLPDKQKEETLQRIEEGDSPTVRELRELKSKLKEKDAIIARQAETINLKNNTIAEKDDIIYRQGEQKAQVIEIEKEIIPSDYETLKLEREDLKQQLKETDKQIEELKKMKAEHLEKSAKYDEMNEFNKKTKGKVNEEQERLQMLKQVYEMIELSKELLIKLTPMPYVIDKKYVQETPLVKSRLTSTAEQINKFYKNLMELLNESEILEGEIINE